MKVAICYIYPMVKPQLYFQLANRFAETYRAFPPGEDHALYVVCNGRSGTDNELRMFNGLPVSFTTHDNSGWDVGGFQRFADVCRDDLLICLGAHCHFYRPNWLKLIVNAYLENGPGLYGCGAYLSPNWHVRTSSFWCPPELLQSYPFYVGSVRKSRYEFEHGNGSFTRHVLKLGFPCIMVTWDGVFPFSEWERHAPDHNNILIRDQHNYNPHAPLARLDGPYFGR